VQQIFKVKVTDVRTAQFSTAKMRRRGQKRRLTGATGKKAYVKLAEGEKMIEYAENL